MGGEAHRADRVAEAEGRVDRDYELSSTATAELDEIIDYIAAEDASAALRVARHFRMTFELLARNPGMGRRRPDLSRDRELRVWTVCSYLVSYWFDDGWVHVTAIVSGHRDVASYLGCWD